MVPERGSLFSAPMVRALLAGEKTQTRRVVMTRSCGVLVPALPYDPKPDASRCPYGVPGDRLWVREAWQVDAPRDGSWADTEFFGCKGAPLSLIPSRYRRPAHVLYRATWSGMGLRWRSPIHMPRWASRLALELTDVRLEPLQAMQARADAGDDTDALAEGIVCEPDHIGPRYGLPGAMTNRTAFAAFARVWDSINQERDAGWNLNPWVWVLTFRALAAEVPA